MNTETQNNRKSLGWSIALGILLIILGLLAIVFPIIATALVTIALGWIFLIGGILRTIYAFQTRSGGFWLKLLLGILYVITGISLLSNIIGGAISLTLALGILIFIEGVFEVSLAFQLRPASNWSWVLVSGIATIILGILIWSQWPFNAPWVLGLLTGISFLSTGIWKVMLSLAARNVINQT